MKKENKLNEQLLFNYLVQNKPELLEEFVRSPESILKKLNISEESLLCSDQQHKAFERAETVSNKVEKLADVNPIRSLPEVTRIVESVFGKDFQVTREPFGLRFSERVKFEDDGGITGTGTFTITWGGDDKDADGDG